MTDVLHEKAKQKMDELRISPDSEQAFYLLLATAIAGKLRVAMELQGLGVSKNNLRNIVELPSDKLKEFFLAKDLKNIDKVLTPIVINLKINS